jgi:hypothetical protein
LFLLRQNEATLKLDRTELSIVKALLEKAKEQSESSDPFVKESLNQYMEDLSRKYKVAWGFVKINMDTGEIVPR